MIFSLLISLIITSILCILVILLFIYNQKWLLRVNRTKYIKDAFYDKLVYLEIKLPREVSKSPQVMEFVFDAIYQVAGTQNLHFDNWFTHFLSNIEKYRAFMSDRYTKGMVRTWMSLEVESREGQLHFYIVTPKRFQDILSSYIYSQYTGIEISEAEDYTNKIRPEYHGGEYDTYTTFFTLKGKDYLPIKTYVDYGLGKDPKEEYKVDPLVPLLESFASVGKNEHIWYQVTARAAMDIGDSWKKAGEARIKEILTKKVKNDKGEEKEEKVSMVSLSIQEKQEVESIQKNIQKLGFDCTIKVIYSAKQGSYKAETEQIVRNAMKSFSNTGYNEFKGNNQNSTQAWHDYEDKRVQRRKRGVWFYLFVMRDGLYYHELDIDGKPFKAMYERFKKFGFVQGKEYFFSDFKQYFTDAGKLEETGAYFVLNAEELATVFHFPGKVLGAPNFDRINSVKSDAPNNLPV